MAFTCYRWTLSNTLPVIFVTWIIGTIWGVHAFLHLAPLIGNDWERAKLEIGVSQPLTIMLLVCFIRAICTDPGSVPKTSDWKVVPVSQKLKWGAVAQAADAAAAVGTADGTGTSAGSPVSFEVKQTGARRYCKWCDMYKPDRCHHCRICRSCILRMDHHCPWIANCVGFGNHKYFLLLVFYALLNVSWVMATQHVSISLSLIEYTPSMYRFLLVFGMTLSALMFTLLSGFFSLHVWFVLKATTTIEFCEKRSSAGRPPSTSYELSMYENVTAVLGANPLFWLLPLAPPAGDGTRFRRSVDGPSSEGDGANKKGLLAADFEPERAVSSAATETASTTFEPPPEVTPS